MSSTFDVVVVGGGMVGAALAALLAQKTPTLNIALVDRNLDDAHRGSEASALDPRVIAISPKSERILRESGAWSAISTHRHCPYSTMEVWEGEGTGRIHFDAAELRRDALGYIVENRIVQDALGERLTEHSSLRQYSGVSVQDVVRENDRMKVVLDIGETIDAALVVAADGAASPLRELAQIPVRRWSYGQSAIVFLAKFSKTHGRCARQVFLSTGPLALLPLVDSHQEEHHCAVVWSCDIAEAEALLGRDDGEFLLAFNGATQGALGDATEIGPRASFPLHQVHATRYYSPGVILVGDAAHSLHPLAGQGANLGFYDVEVLVEEIARAEKRGLPLNDLSIARRYQRRRQCHNLAAMSAMEGFKRLFGSDALLLRLVRNQGLSAVDRAWPIKRWLAQAAAGLQ